MLIAVVLVGAGFLVEPVEAQSQVRGGCASWALIQLTSESQDAVARREVRAGDLMLEGKRRAFADRQFRVHLMLRMALAAEADNHYQLAKFFLVAC